MRRGLYAAVVLLAAGAAGAADGENAGVAANGKIDARRLADDGA